MSIIIGIFGWPVLTGSIIAIISSIFMLWGRWVKWSTILVIIAGTLSIPLFFGGWVYVWPGLLEQIGAVIALFT